MKNIYHTDFGKIKITKFVSIWNKYRKCECAYIEILETL